MSYSSVFGGTTIYPSEVTYLAVALSADITLEWPLESNSPTYPAARIIDVTAAGAYSITLPDATLTSAGQTILFNNLSGSSSSFTVKDNSGATIATLTVGTQWQVYLSGTSTAAGTWRVLQYGASTATVQASALAGYGLTVTSNQLSQSTPVTTFNSSPRTLLTTDRASMFVWTGSGAATVNLPTAASAGNNYYFSVRNAGGGDVTVDPSGAETVDGAATLTLHPGDSTSIATDGISWYSLGLGQQAIFAFDYTSISLASAAATYTLAGSELNRVTYKFTGLLTNNVAVVVPSTVQQYWVDNSTTGAFTVSLKTAAGTPVVVTQGSRGIYYCNGTNVVDADTATVSLPISAADGGTGQTSYAIGDLIYASGATTLSKLADVATGNALISGGVTTAPSWGKIGLTTHVSGTLPVGSGGTGITTTPTNGQIPIGNGTNYVAAAITAGTGITVTNGAGSITIASTGGSGTVTSVALSGGTTGLSVSGSPITTSGTITLSGTLIAANGGTGQSSYAVGDLLYASTTSALSKLADVATGNALISGGVNTAPSWGKIGLTTHVSGTLAIGNGGTGSTSTTYCDLATNVTGTLPATNGGTGYALYAVGDILYASTTTALSKLADVATGSVLISGGVGVAPSYGKVGLTTHVSGTLAIGNGGTGVTGTATNGQLLIGNGSGYTLATITAGSGITVTNGSGTITIASTAGGGSVTSVDVSGGTTGLSFSGGPVTTSGTITAGGTLIAANGGTGFASYTVGDILFATTSTTFAKLSDVATGNAIISGGVGAAPLYGKIGLTTHITGTLGVGNGGTGLATTPLNGKILIGNGTDYTLANITAGSGISITNGVGSITIDATGSGGTVTSVGISGGTTGLTFSGSPITTSGTATMSGTLGVGNGGTGLSTFAVGDLMYASSSSALSKLADVATGNVLLSGGVTTAPSYGKVGLTTHVSGQLGLANGGTGGTDAATARSGIGAAASGANTDITSLAQSTTVAATGTAAANSIGFMGLPQLGKTASYTLALTEFGYEVYISGTTAAQTITIPANGSVAFPVGAFVVITNDSNQNWSIAITTDTLLWSPNSTTGTRTLAPGGTCTLAKKTSTRWWIYGTGLT